MLLESLIIATCVASPGYPCRKLGEFYYKEKKIDVAVKRLRRQYPATDEVIARTLLLSSMINERKVTVPVFSQGTQTVIMTLQENQIYVIHRLEF